LGEREKIMASNKLSVTFSLPPEMRLGDKAKQIIQLRFDHPEWTQKQIATTVGISESRVSIILHHPKVVAALPIVAKERLRSMVPKAMKAYEKLVDQDVNLQVKEKAAGKVLGENKVFDAPVVKVDHEITLRSVGELREIVEKAVKNPDFVVDAEIVPEKSE
jgi:hypothetical protein